ncbi:MAG TPA: SdrD B-like domain-containing protein, partial [Tepidisphaeraceae bacterium]|nr:SdrD B-like domain-containing protein [Tepidisphaeraceae bacterium]
MNGDGTFDAGDQPLLGHVIFLDVNNNGLFDRGEQRTTTDSNGNYTLQFSSGGTYNIGVVATAGWSMTAPANPTIPITGATGQTFSGENFGFEQTQPTAIVQGKTYGDNNGNGVYDTGDYAGTGTLIYIDVNDNGVFDPGEPGTLADTSSNYSLTVLANTSQVVRADITPLKTNYYTAPASGYYTVSLASNQVAPGYDFAYAPGVSASGSFYDDLNGNGVLDAGEPPLSGWQVNVYQGATLLTTLTTDSNGNFSVNALPVQSGELDFEPVTKSGWLESGVSDAGYAIYAPQVISNLDFFATQLSICAGSVLNDKDWSLSYTSGDAYLPGWTVFADLNHNGQLDLGEPSAVTDKFGDYRLAVPAADDFDLQLVIPSGWRSLMPLSGYWPVSGGTPKRLLDSFYVTNTGGIYGAVFNDLNLDGFYNTNESGVSGVSVYIDTNNDGVWESGEPELLSSSAAPVGSFAFKALAAGTYNIRFITPPGWVPSTDWTNQAWTVTIGTAQVYDGVEFGMVNRPMLVNAGGPYAILEGQ